MNHAVLCLLLSFSLTLSVAAQQPSNGEPQPLILLQKSLSALSGGQSLTDVTLSGTAHRNAGSDDDNGTAIFKALASGASRMDLILPSGQRSEIQNGAGGVPTGAWSGSDGVSHSIPEHNLQTDPAWFFPPLSLAKYSNPQSCTASYVGPETRSVCPPPHRLAAIPESRPARRCILAKAKPNRCPSRCRYGASGRHYIQRRSGQQRTARHSRRDSLLRLPRRRRRSSPISRAEVPQLQPDSRSAIS